MIAGTALEALHHTMTVLLALRGSWDKRAD